MAYAVSSSSEDFVHVVNHHDDVGFDGSSPLAGRSFVSPLIVNGSPRYKGRYYTVAAIVICASVLTWCGAGA